MLDNENSEKSFMKKMKKIHKALGTTADEALHLFSVQILSKKTTVV